MRGPDPKRRCLGALFLLSATTSLEWLLPFPAAQLPPFTAEEEDSAARIGNGASMADDLRTRESVSDLGEVRAPHRWDQWMQNGMFTLLVNKINQYLSVFISVYFLVLTIKLQSVWYVVRLTPHRSMVSSTCGP
jgi:hypothetical protein